ncbi:winged helix-turn-helix domain-containing protein [Methanolobus sp.]|uniref:helix-turn-helix transcriptional regulator n=1 Tax=Methanolobus sp. TaxID=1874737 RepID=UPI0025EE501D|nr:winged helix-turn-helix domain-containing protein [Methanolobus sp.]
MKTSLVNTVWFSEKRKNLLLLLTEGTRDIEQIKRSLNVTTRAIMPQIKMLKQHHLIDQAGDSFSLTTTGEIIVKSMSPLLETSRIIEENKDFWTTRNYDALPSHLFSRLRELGHYFLIEPDINHLFELPREFTENIPRSKNIMTFASYLHPAFSSLYSEIADSVDEISLFLTMPAFEKLKKEHIADYTRLMRSDSARIFLFYDNIKLPMITVTDWFSYICLFNEEGRYDHRDIISFDESALKWCHDFFEYYKTYSKEVLQ